MGVLASNRRNYEIPNFRIETFSPDPYRKVMLRKMRCRVNDADCISPIHLRPNRTTALKNWRYKNQSSFNFTTMHKSKTESTDFSFARPLPCLPSSKSPSNAQFQIAEKTVVTEKIKEVTLWKVHPQVFSPYEDCTSSSQDKEHPRSKIDYQPTEIQKATLLLNKESKFQKRIKNAWDLFEKRQQKIKSEVEYDILYYGYQRKIFKLLKNISDETLILILTPKFLECGTACDELNCLLSSTRFLVIYFSSTLKYNNIFIQECSVPKEISPLDLRSYNVVKSLCYSISPPAEITTIENCNEKLLIYGSIQSEFTGKCLPFIINLFPKEKDDKYTRALMYGSYRRMLDKKPQFVTWKAMAVKANFQIK